MHALYKIRALGDLSRKISCGIYSRTNILPLILHIELIMWHDAIANSIACFIELALSCTETMK